MVTRRSSAAIACFVLFWIVLAALPGARLRWRDVVDVQLTAAIVLLIVIWCVKLASPGAGGSR